MAETARQRGVGVEIHGARAGDPRVLAELGAKATLTYSANVHSDSAMFEYAQRSFLQGNSMLFEDLRALRSEFGPHDTLFFPNLLQQEVLGLGLWLSTFRSRHPSTVALIRWDLAKSPYFQMGLRILGTQPRTRLCTDTAPLARAFAESGMPSFDVVPIPHVRAGLGAPPEPPPGIRAWLATEPRLPVIGFLGEARPDKGFTKLPAIIRGCWAQQVPCRFLIACSPSNNRDAGVATAMSELEGMSSSRLHLAVGHHDNTTYDALMGACHAAIMPYQAELYHRTSSGVVAEALAAAKVVIVPNGTWMAEESERFKAGAIVTSDTVEGFVAAVAAYTQHATELHRDANSAAPGVRQFHNPERLVDYLMAA